uniref:Uncharacterized protein n=1 Tax=Periophthalmus magnuspinnatus TaxID=409849 RepID=A0A3B3ZUI2_9GOBI
MARYADKVVIVTGGSKGIGRGIVTAFGKVSVTCVTGAAGEALEAELNPKGPGCCKFLSCDMNKEDNIQELASHTADAAAAITDGENCQLLGRMGTEAECGAAAMFLAADASFCTGIDLLLSGGAELNYGFKNQTSGSK